MFNMVRVGFFLFCVGVVFCGVDVPVIIFYFFIIIYCPQSNLTMSRFVPVIMVCLDIKRGKSVLETTQNLLFKYVLFLMSVLVHVI